MYTWLASPTNNPSPLCGLGSGRDVPVKGMTPDGVTEVIYNKTIPCSILQNVVYDSVLGLRFRPRWFSVDGNKKKNDVTN